MINSYKIHKSILAMLLNASKLEVSLAIANLRLRPSKIGYLDFNGAISVCLYLKKNPSDYWNDI